MYLDDIVEQIKDYKVVIYQDHFPDQRKTRYFDTYDDAFSFYKSKLGDTFDANYTATVALVVVKTGEPLLRETWRVHA